MQALTGSGVFAVDCRVLNDREIEIGYLFIGLDECLGQWRKVVNQADPSQSFLLKIPDRPPSSRLVLEYRHAPTV